MQVRAIARGIRMSPRKAQLVVEAIRGRSAREAVAFLETSPKAASEVVLKVVRSALANAANNFSLNPERLVVVSATADKGRVLLDAVGVQLARLLQELVAFEPLI
mgnify:CR=1 FL=1